MSAKSETNKKNNAFRAELRAAMERCGIRSWSDLITRWGLPRSTVYYRREHPETITVHELRVLCAVLRLDEEGKQRLMGAAI